MFDNPKLFRVTTADISLHALLEGQLGFLNKKFEVVGIAADTGLLKEVGMMYRCIGRLPYYRISSAFSSLSDCSEKKGRSSFIQIPPREVCFR